MDNFYILYGLSFTGNISFLQGWGAWGLVRVKLRYGAYREDIERFVRENDCVSMFLGRYKESPITYGDYARSLCMFFKWLRLQDIRLGPKEFLDFAASKRASSVPSDRVWGKNLLLGFGRDNPDLKDKSATYKNTHFLVPVIRFCNDNEVQLTSSKGLIQKVQQRKYGEPAFTVDLARRVLGCLSQRDRAVCMMLLQSGQSERQILVDLNGRGESTIREVEAGHERIRLDFKGRKGNGKSYFTFIGHDAVVELRKWLVIRREWLNNPEIDVKKRNEAEKYLFITNRCGVLTPEQFGPAFRETLEKRGLWTGPFTVRTHMFRKIFESEASPPDRGINKLYVAFMMGHSGGNGAVSKLDMPGGTYDNAPRVYSEIVEKEYAKLEKWLNIYSQHSVGVGLSGEDREVLEFWRTKGFKDYILKKMREDGYEV